MTSDDIGAFIGFFVVFILPILIGLILVIKAKALVRARLCFLSEYGGEDLEPSGCAVAMCRTMGWFFIIVPVILFLAILSAALNHAPL
ncbi:MAG: hypothetical protein M3Z08_02785 [Chloroflexota bacterium]|nr:hypothetical protein [Chloroflexota bacterium]